MPICKIKDKLILFIHVPRTGGVTIEHHLSELGGVFFKNSARSSLLRVTAQHFHRDDLKAIFPANTFDYVFMTVRNPFDRLRSVYAFQKAQHVSSKFVPFQLWLRLAMLRRKSKPYFRDNHFRPQSEFEAFNAEIFRLEDGLDKIFDRLHDKFRVDRPASIEVLNSRPGPRPILSASDIRIIQDVYREDFERFGYDLAGAGAL